MKPFFVIILAFAFTSSLSFAKENLAQKIGNRECKTTITPNPFYKWDDHYDSKEVTLKTEARENLVRFALSIVTIKDGKEAMRINASGTSKPTKVKRSVVFDAYSRQPRLSKGKDTMIALDGGLPVYFWGGISGTELAFVDGGSNVGNLLFECKGTDQ